MQYNNLTIVYNGEIYNYEWVKDLLISHGYKFDTEGDCEVVLKAFDMWGRAAFSILKECGHFVFITKWAKTCSAVATGSASSLFIINWKGYFLFWIRD